LSKSTKFWETSLDARNLGLEITESAIIENAESANIMWQMQWV